MFVNGATAKKPMCRNIVLSLLAGLCLVGSTSAQRKAVARLEDYSGDFGQKVQSCIGDLSRTGGICDATGLAGDQSLSKDLVLDHSDTVLLLGAVTLQMGIHRIVVPPGVANVEIRGVVAYSDNPRHGYGGSYLKYTGSDSAIIVGAAGSDTSGFHFESVTVDISSAAPNAVGITIVRTQQLSISSVEVKGWQHKANQQVLVRLDGGGNYTGGIIRETHLTGGNIAIQGVGQKGSGANALTILQSHIGGSYLDSGHNSVGIDLECADGDTIIGTDVEGWDVAYRLGPNAIDNTLVGVRYEHTNKQDFQLAAGSAGNIIFAAETNGRIEDMGTNNSVFINYRTRFDNGGLVLSGKPKNVGNGQLGLGSQTTPSASSGNAAALPARPAGYLTITISGKDYKLPYFSP